MLKKYILVCALILTIVLTGCEDEEITKLNNKITTLTVQNTQLKQRINNFHNEKTQKNKENVQLKNKIAILETKIDQYKNDIKKSKNILKKEYQTEFENDLTAKIRERERQDARTTIWITLFVLVVLLILFVIIFRYTKTKMEDHFNQKIDYFQNKIKSINDMHQEKMETEKNRFKQKIDYYQQKIKDLEKVNIKDANDIYKRSLLDEKFDNRLTEIDKAIDNCLHHES